jgi:hypothetical protein
MTPKTTGVATIRLDRRRGDTPHIMPPTVVAKTYAALGDTDQAFLWLQKACDMRDPLLLSLLGVDTVFDPLRDDPRYRQILRCMHQE